MAMLLGEPREAGDGTLEISQERVYGGAQGQHGRGIDHVLAGGAPMHITRSLRVGLGDVGREHFHQRDGQIAGARCGLGQASEIEGLGFAGFRDRLGHALGDDAGRGFGPR